MYSKNITNLTLILGLIAASNVAAKNTDTPWPGTEKQCPAPKYAARACKKPCYGIWAGTIGALSHQDEYSENYGYNAKALGGIYGIEGYTRNGSTAGLAFANTNSNLYEDNQRRTVRLLGYHVMLYGNTSFASDSYFMDWLLTGVINKNKLSFQISPGSQFYSSTTSYRTSQAAARINLGQSTENDLWKFSLIEHVSYQGLYQEDYLTHNSSAARYYTPRRWSNLVTVGGGVRMAFTATNPWVKTTGGVRVMGLYDAVRTIQETTANFINSLDNFTLSSSPSRWAFQAGINYSLICIGCVNLDFSYDFELRTKYTNNAAAIKLSILF